MNAVNNITIFRITHSLANLFRLTASKPLQTSTSDESKEVVIPQVEAFFRETFQPPLNSVQAPE